MIRRWASRVVARIAGRLMDADWLETMRFRERQARWATHERRASWPEKTIWPERRNGGKS